MLAEAERDARLTRVERINKRLKAALALMAGLTLVSIGLGAAPQKAVVKSVKAQRVDVISPDGVDIVRIGPGADEPGGCITISDGTEAGKVVLGAVGDPCIALLSKDEGPFVGMTAYDKLAIVEVMNEKTEDGVSLFSDIDRAGGIDISYGPQRVHAYTNPSGETAIMMASKDLQKTRWMVGDSEDGVASLIFLGKGNEERIKLRVDKESVPSITMFGAKADLGFLAALDEDSGSTIQLFHGKEKDASETPTPRSALMDMDHKGLMFVYGPDRTCGGVMPVDKADDSGAATE